MGPGVALASYCTKGANFLFWVATDLFVVPFLEQQVYWIKIALCDDVTIVILQAVHQRTPFPLLFGHLVAVILIPKPLFK